MNKFDETGIQVDRKSDIVDQLALAVRALWGEDHRTDPESSTGQFIEIFSEIFADQNELMLSLSTSHQPSKAFGVWLSELVKLNGIERNESSRTTVAITVTANGAASEILAGDLVDTEAGIGPFAVDNDVSLSPLESKTISATATNVGDIEVAENTITKILTPRLGWASVNNASAGSPGRSEEKDPALKDRRTRAAGAVGVNTSTRLYDNLLDDEAITEVKIIENPGETTDGYGVPRQHTWAIIFGGQDETIARIMYETTGGGAGTWGSESFLYQDLDRDLEKTMYWTRPDDITIQVEVRTRKGSSYPSSGDDIIKEAINTWFADGNVRLGGIVARGDLYAPAYTVTGHQVQDIYLGRDGGGLANSDISLDPDERATNVILDITVTEVS